MICTKMKKINAKSMKKAQKAKRAKEYISQGERKSSHGARTKIKDVCP